MTGILWGFLIVFGIFLQIAAFIVLLWIGWKFFDQRYKKRDAPPKEMLDGSLVKTKEVYIDPKDGLKYRVYYNPRTGEREYIRE